MKTSIPIVRAVRFEVDDSMVIIDPCYIDKDDAPDFDLLYKHTSGVVVPDCAGEWTAEIVMSDQGSWGERVETLSLVRTDNRGYYVNGFELLHNDHGVDSGQMYAGCLSNLPLDYERLLTGYNVDKDKPYGGDNYSNANILAVEGGVVSSTGYGDGQYSSYVRRDRNGRPFEIEVRFLEELEEDEYEDEEEVYEDDESDDLVDDGFIDIDESRALGQTGD